MKKDVVTKLLKRGFFSEVVNIGAEGSGSIDFSSDGPDVPFPVVVWFDRGYVCGVDLKKW